MLFLSKDCPTFHHANSFKAFYPQYIADSFDRAPVIVYNQYF